MRMASMTETKITEDEVMAEADRSERAAQPVKKIPNGAAAREMGFSEWPTRKASGPEGPVLGSGVHSVSSVPGAAPGGNSSRALHRPALERQRPVT